MQPRAPLPRPRIRTAILVLVAVALVGCGGDDEAGPVSTTATTEQPDADLIGGGEVELAVISDDTSYVRALCTVDYFGVDENEPDPMGWVIDKFENLPAITIEERDEVAWMIERLERVKEMDDPSASDDLASVAAVIRARCS